MVGQTPQRTCSDAVGGVVVQGAPQWTFLLAAVGLFFYQSLDAIDGKQARRTGTSSPLGELFDHGCDSVSVSEYLLSAG